MENVMKRLSLRRRKSSSKPRVRQDEPVTSRSYHCSHSVSFTGSVYTDNEVDSKPQCSGNEVTAKIDVFPYTYDPTISWDLLKSRHVVKRVKTLKLDTPCSDSCVRFVCMADTHGRHGSMCNKLPDGDILLVAGDFTTCGHPAEIIAFNEFLGTLPHRYKVVVAGNHELTFDPQLRKANYMGFERVFKNYEAKCSRVRRTIEDALVKRGLTDVRRLLTNCIYLEDCEVDIYGIRIYGTPWQPAFDNWAFNLPRGSACLQKWNKIPTGIDVLVTHTPALGYGDLTSTGVRAGCVELLNSINKRIKPKYHVFGHVHEGYGITTDGQTKFINCCVCDDCMKPRNAPIIFDIQLPQGYSK